MTLSSSATRTVAWRCPGGRRRTPVALNLSSVRDGAAWAQVQTWRGCVVRIRCMIVAMENAGEKIKVWFRFVPREGWLPQDTEGLWATKLSDDTARVENVPFLQDGVAEGDVVRYRTDSDGLHWAVGQVSSSGNCTVRVVPVPTGPLGRSPQAVHQRLSAFSLGGEVFSVDFPMVAFTAP